MPAADVARKDRLFPQMARGAALGPFDLGGAKTQIGDIGARLAHDAHARTMRPGQHIIGQKAIHGADDFARNPLNSGDRLHQETAIDHDFLAGGGHLRAFSRKAPGGSRKRAIASKAKRFPNL